MRRPGRIRSGSAVLRGMRRRLFRRGTTLERRTLVSRLDKDTAPYVEWTFKG